MVRNCLRTHDKLNGRDTNNFGSQQHTGKSTVQSAIVSSATVVTDANFVRSFASLDRPITAKLPFCDDGAIFMMRHVKA